MHVRLFSQVDVIQRLCPARSNRTYIKTIEKKRKRELQSVSVVGWSGPKRAKSSHLVLGLRTMSSKQQLSLRFGLFKVVHDYFFFFTPFILFHPCDVAKVICFSLSLSHSLAYSLSGTRSEFFRFLLLMLKLQTLSFRRGVTDHHRQGRTIPGFIEHTLQFLSLFLWPIFDLHGVRLVIE